MGLHAYCVLPPRSEPAVRGIDEAPVCAVPLRATVVWTSEHPRRPTPDAAAIRAHDRVIRSALTPHVTPVPFRFGQWFDGEGALAEAAAGQESRWQSWLGEFAGLVEMGLRVPASGVAPPAPAPQARASGTAFMQELLERHRRERDDEVQAARILGMIREALGAFMVRESMAPSRPDDLLSVAYLVRRADLTAHDAALALLRKRLADRRLLATGPWPPYSFVT